MDFSVGLLMILLIPLIIFIFVLCWISDIAKNTRTMVNNIVELDKRNQERNEKLIIELQQQNELLKTQNRMFAHIISKQQPTAQQENNKNTTHAMRVII